MELKIIKGLLDEYEYLTKKAKLLDEILVFYNKETGSIDIPDKWKNSNRIGSDIFKDMPKSPRHMIAKKIIDNLPFSESESLVDWEFAEETIGA